MRIVTAGGGVPPDAGVRGEAGRSARRGRAGAKGPDFRPPGGESPREVQVRVVEWARTAAGAVSNVVAITHKGVIKATMGLACGWDLTGKAPVRLDWRCW